MDLFGFEISFNRKKDDPENQDLRSIARDQNDGSLVVTKGEHYGDLVGETWGYSTTMDIDPLLISETALITKYREISLVPEVDKAIDIIVNEIVSTSAEKPVSIDLDNLDYSEGIKNKIEEEFNYVLKLLDFNNSCYEIIRRWYIDGRLHYQVVIDQEQYKQNGIGKLTYLDPRKIKKVRVVKQDKDQRTGVNTYQEKKSYYLYSEAGFMATNNNFAPGLDIVGQTNGAVSIAEDAIVQITSGLLDPTNSVVLSYLHKAIRPLNQLKSLEDATMIYKISRAPERRIFYIDVGNLPPAKAEQVLQKQMNQYRSKMIYDVNTGTVRSDPKQMTMIEDYWLPRRSDGRATEITTLPGGTQLGQMDELNYFLNKLYNSLNVPITRMDPSTGFSFGRATEITRDEVMLAKFVARLRRRISVMFLELLRRQLSLKNILNEKQFEAIKDDIKFIYESDNHFDEMLKTEIFESRLNLLDRMVGYMPGGQFPTMFSKEYAYKEVLYLTEEEIQLLEQQIDKEKKELPPPEEGEGGFDGPDISRVIHSADKTSKAMNTKTPQTSSNATQKINTNKEDNNV